MSITITIIIILILCIWFLSEQYYNKTYFTNANSNLYYPILVNKFGRPDVLYNMADGIAMWNNPVVNKNYTRIYLMDEKGDLGFLYFTITMDIPKNKLCKVVEFSESVKYDRAKKELMVRGSTIEEIEGLIEDIKNIV